MKFILSGDTHGTFDLDKIIIFFQKRIQLTQKKIIS